MALNMDGNLRVDIGGPILRLTPRLPGSRKKTNPLVRTLPSPHASPLGCTSLGVLCHATGAQLMPADACWGELEALFPLCGAQCTLLIS